MLNKSWIGVFVAVVGACSGEPVKNGDTNDDGDSDAAMTSEPEEDSATLVCDQSASAPLPASCSEFRGSVFADRESAQEAQCTGLGGTFSEKGRCPTNKNLWGYCVYTLGLEASLVHTYYYRDNFYINEAAAQTVCETLADAVWHSAQ